MSNLAWLKGAVTPKRSASCSSWDSVKSVIRPRLTAKTASEST